MDPIQVRMLGCFTLQFRDKLISDTDNRAKKVWSLLAYLLIWLAPVWFLTGWVHRF